MKTKQNTIRWLVIGGLAVTFVGLLFVFAQGVGIAKTSMISAEVAVNQALIYSKDDGLFGGSLSQPSKILGQLTTF